MSTAMLVAAFALATLAVAIMLVSARGRSTRPEDRARVVESALRRARAKQAGLTSTPGPHESRRRQQLAPIVHEKS